MRRKTITGWLMMLLVAVCFSCGNKAEKKALGESKGLPSELLLVVDPSLWNSSARDSLEGMLKGSVPGLSQQEPMFRMMRLFPENYSAKYSTMRNILEVRKNPKVKTAGMVIARNVKAVPQLYVSIATPDVESLNHFLAEKGDEIAGMFVEMELQREQSLLEKKYSKLVDEATRDVFSWSVKVPADIAKVKKSDDFVWASTDRLTQDLNFVCYSLPLDVELTENRWVTLRDSALKRNIPGGRPGQWMMTTVEHGDTLVMLRRASLPDGRELSEMRGLWEMHDDAIGGPFVSLAYPDSANGRTLVVEGFVYSPNTDKRDLIRRMEGALRTFVPVGR